MIDTEPLPVPVEVNVEQDASENRVKQEQEVAQKERDELKETLKAMMKLQKERKSRRD